MSPTYRSDRNTLSHRFKYETATIRDMTPEPDRPVEGAIETESAGLEERLDAVERALTGGDPAVTDVGDGAAATAEREALAERLDAVEERLEELEAATQAVRGYAGAIRSVNREVERRADLALARATDARDATRPGTAGSDAAGGVAGSDAPGGTAGSDAPGEVPSDPSIEAAIPGDDPATKRTHGPDTSDREGAGEGGSTEDGSESSPLERLRNAL